MPRKPVTARTSFSVAETFLGQPARMLANEVLEIGRCDGRFPAHVFGGAKSLQPPGRDMPEIFRYLPVTQARLRRYRVAIPQRSRKAGLRLRPRRAADHLSSGFMISFRWPSTRPPKAPLNSILSIALMSSTLSQRALRLPTDRGRQGATAEQAPAPRESKPQTSRL